MDEKRIAIIFAVVLGIAAVIAIIVGSVKKEGFNRCFCTGKSGGRGRRCQDADLAELAYEFGITEYNPRWLKPEWSKVSPGDINFPQSAGCGMPAESKPPGWVTWDFTDFGSNRGRTPYTHRELEEIGSGRSQVYASEENYTYNKNQPYHGSAVL